MNKSGLKAIDFLYARYWHSRMTNGRNLRVFNAVVNVRACRENRCNYNYEPGSEHARTISYLELRYVPKSMNIHKEC
ncbi:MAG: hypothetical protein F4X56_02140 [Gammaproteobacteria bacterium]|nr:hypothetical protein [Gammaproteobacteria bacterium]